MNFAMTRARASLLPVAVVALTTLLFTTTLHATLTTSSLTGRVTVGNEPAAGATVTVSSPSLHLDRTATTDAEGRYWLGALPAGACEVTFARPGLASLTRPVVIELGRVARADAQLEPSEDEETVTSTKTTIGVSDTTAITSHFSDEELDRLPYDRPDAAQIAPGAAFRPAVVDDVPVSATLIGGEAVEEIVVFRGAVPVEIDDAAHGIVSAQVRSGTDAWLGSLRDTFLATGKHGHFAEGAAGGRIARDRAWFFASIWGGDRPAVDDIRGAVVKLTAQLAAAHRLDAVGLGTESAVDARDRHAIARYAGLLGSDATAEVNAGDDGGTAVLSYATRGHVLRGGVARRVDDDGDALFAADRWMRGRWTVDAGVRHERSHSHTLPRAAIAFDLRGDGRAAAIATHGEYIDSAGEVARVSTIGMATAIGSSGAARADALHRESRISTLDQLQVDARYRLFDRLEAGAYYTWSDLATAAIALRVPAHVGTAWAGVELPIGSREVGTTVLQRYDGERWLTDVGLWLVTPAGAHALRIGADATNLFGRDPLESGPRVARLWLRFRI